MDQRYQCQEYPLGGLPEQKQARGLLEERLLDEQFAD